MKLKQFLQSSVDDQPGLAVTSMLVGLMALSLQDALGKLLSEHLSLWQFQACRALMNILFVLLLARWMLRGVRLMPTAIRPVFIRSLVHMGALTFFFGSAPFLTMAEMAGGLYTFPLFVAVLSAVFLSERVGVRRIVAILIGFAGTLLILQPGTDAFRPAGLLPMGAGLCYSIFIIITRRYCRGESPVVLTLASNITICIGGMIGMLTVALIDPSDTLKASLPTLMIAWKPMVPWVAGVLVVCTIFNVIGNICLSKAYQNAESSFLAPFDYSYLVFAAFWGFVFWHDFPTVTTLVGMVMIAGSGIYVAWRERQLQDATQ